MKITPTEGSNNWEAHREALRATVAAEEKSVPSTPIQVHHVPIDTSGTTWKVEPEKKASDILPGITVLIYIVASLAMFGGGIAFISGWNDRNDSEIGVGLGAVFMSLLTFGFGAAIRKLYQIEAHLR